MFGKVQDMIKECLLKINNNKETTHKSQHIKHASTKEFHSARIDQLNAMENEFKDKAEKLRVCKS